MALNPPPRERAISGNHVKVLLGGVEVGYVGSIQAHESTNPEELSGIGSILVKEHVPSRWLISLAVDRMVVRTKSLLVHAENLWGNEENILSGKTFDLEVQGVDGAVLRTYHNCSFASGTTRIHKHTILVEDASFMCTHVSGFNTLPADGDAV